MMTIEECVSALKDLMNHSCDLKDADFGWYDCCNQKDYRGHKKDCRRVEAISLAISMMKERMK